MDIFKQPNLGYMTGWDGTSTDFRSPAGGAGPGPGRCRVPGSTGTGYDLLATALNAHPGAPTHKFGAPILLRPFAAVQDVTAAQLHGILPHLTVAEAARFTPHLNTYFQKYEIDTYPRRAAFIGQVAVESNEFRRLTENLHYTAKRLHAVFPNKFKTEESAEDYAGNPEKLANFVYAGIIGNGVAATGDGWKFRGRGLIQLTGRANYQAFKNASGIDVVDDPDLVSEPRIAVYAAAWFWDKHKLNGLVDSGQFEKLTQHVNAAKLEFSKREEYRKRAQLLFFKDAFASSVPGPFHTGPALRFGIWDFF